MSNPNARRFTKNPPLFVPFLFMSEIAQVLISFSVGVFGKTLVLLVLKSIGKLLWTPTDMGSFLVGVTLVCGGMCRHIGPYGRQNTAPENTSLAGTHVLVDLQVGAGALRGGSSCGQGCAC